MSANVMRMSESARLSSRDQFKLILDHIADGVVVQAANAELVYLNPAASRLLGFVTVEAALLAGTPGLLKDFAALYDDEDNPLPVEQLPGRQALRGQKEPAQVVKVKLVDYAAGTWKWAWVKASPICEEGSDKPLFVVTVFQEITTMKKTEQGLREANQRVVDILEDVLDKSAR